MIEQINHHTQAQTSPDKPMMVAWKKLKRVLQTILKHVDGTLLELDKDLRKESWTRAADQQDEREAKKDDEPEPEQS